MRETSGTGANPGRPREFDEEEVLLEIMELFWEHGYEGTGLSDILKTTGLGKASLYAAYGNKQSIYLKALSHYEALQVDPVIEALRDKRKPALRRIESFLDVPINAVKKGERRGCFLCNASADRASLDTEISDLVRRGYEKFRKALEETIKEMSKKPDAKLVKSRAQLALTVYAGAAHHGPVRHDAVGACPGESLLSRHSAKIAGGKPHFERLTFSGLARATGRACSLSVSVFSQFMRPGRLLSPPFDPVI